MNEIGTFLNKEKTPRRHKYKLRVLTWRILNIIGLKPTFYHQSELLKSIFDPKNCLTSSQIQVFHYYFYPFNLTKACTILEESTVHL